MNIKEQLNKIAKEEDLFSTLSQDRKTINAILVNVANVIRNKRREMKKTQKEFAKFMGVSQGMVSKWESAEYNFTVESLVAILSKLSITPKVILKNNAEPSAIEMWNSTVRRVTATKSAGNELIGGAA